MARGEGLGSAIGSRQQGVKGEKYPFNSLEWRNSGGAGPTGRGSQGPAHNRFHYFCKRSQTF